MRRYYFDVDDGETRERDEVGVDLVDDQQARDEAFRALGDLAKHYIPGPARQRNLTMWVRRDDDTVILQLAFSFAIEPV